MTSIWRIGVPLLIVVVKPHGVRTRQPRASLRSTGTMTFVGVSMSRTGGSGGAAVVEVVDDFDGVCVAVAQLLATSARTTTPQALLRRARPNRADSLLPLGASWPMPEVSIVALAASMAQTNGTATGTGSP